MIAFDTETTGLLKPDACDISQQPELIEIYACKFNWDGKILAEFSTLIRPRLPIPPMITEITGISDSNVRNAPRFIQAYDMMCEFFLGEKTVFAHNCSFDIGVLANELRRYDLQYRFPWPQNHICTVETSFPIKNKRMKLGELYELATGKSEIVGAHRAKTDVMAMVECIIWLKKQGFFNEAIN